jgi:hypothetical protein
LNPVRAKIAKRPEDYAWTGHLSYLGRGRQHLIDEGLVLDQLGGSRSSARRKYHEFVWEGISRGHDEHYYEVKEQRYLGGEDFIDRVETERKEPDGCVYDIELEAICHEVSQAMGITEGKMHSSSRDREGVRGRSVVAYLARKISGYTVKEIAEYFKRSSVTIGEGIIKVEERVRGDNSFRKLLKRLEDNVIKGRKRKYRVSVA